MKLLAYRPFYLDPKMGILYSYTAPEWEWPQHTVVKAQCSVRHVVPDEKCTCGIHSTLDLLGQREIVEANLEGDRWPILGIVQVLGPTVVEGNILRSQSVFLWGVIKPANPPQEGNFSDLNAALWNRYRPWIYLDAKEAHEDVKETWEEFQIKPVKEKA